MSTPGRYRAGTALTPNRPLMVSPSTLPLTLILSKGKPELRMYVSADERLRSSFDRLRASGFRLRCWIP
jgi:hypothetical protein